MIAVGIKKQNLWSGCHIDLSNNISLYHYCCLVNDNEYLSQGTTVQMQEHPLDLAAECLYGNKEGGVLRTKSVLFVCKREIAKDKDTAMGRKKC